MLNANSSTVPEAHVHCLTVSKKLFRTSQNAALHFSSLCLFDANLDDSVFSSVCNKVCIINKLDCIFRVVIRIFDKNG